MDRIRSLEECPLNRLPSQYEKRTISLKGPVRVLRLCLLGISLPALLLGLPLYMRYRVYGFQLYPFAMSDMRMLDNKVSTTWCQRQLVKANTTFNAFLLPDVPKLATQYKHLSMVRHLTLEDDTKEYWGFYLLKGSTVTVSTCVRWPGASLIVIRGHRHLHECAYIGDDSSEELDELMRAVKEGTHLADEKNLDLKDHSAMQDDPANKPLLMKRQRPEVEFHSPVHNSTYNKNHTIDYRSDEEAEIELTDPKAIKKILESIKMKKNGKTTSAHIRRNSTMAKNETKNFHIESSHVANSQEIASAILTKLQGMGAKGSEILEKVNKLFKTEQHTESEPVYETMGRHYSKPSVNFSDGIDRSRRRRRDLIDRMELTKDDSQNDEGIEEGFTLTPDGIADHRGTLNETTMNDMSNSEFWSSFSSSEEALLNCAGLILNLPLTPHHNCQEHLSEDEARETYLANSVTYTVPVNGYYFFVFNSENEIQPNYVQVRFDIRKAVYDVSTAMTCHVNDTGVCAFDLSFFSSQKLVVELPIRENETLWNEEFVVVSECEPRTAVYAACVIAVPVLVMLFAFS